MSTCLTDVSHITNVIKLVVFNISEDSDSPPDVKVKNFSRSVTDFSDDVKNSQIF